MTKPAAEIALPVDFVRELVRSQHPDLATLPIAEVASGWDNAIFRLGDKMAIRLPRRSAAAGLVKHEQRWLPLLQSRLPLPVPAPIRIGRPQGSYPWSWSITPWIEGETADRAPLDGDQGTVLATFLEALHTSPPAQAPRSPYRGVPSRSEVQLSQGVWARSRGAATLSTTASCTCGTLRSRRHLTPR